MTDIPALEGSMSLPRIQHFPEQPVLVRHADLSMAEIASIDSKGSAILQDVLSYLDANGIEERGAAFFRYDVVDMDGVMSMSFGAQVAEGTLGSDDIRAEILPAGRYVTLNHHGHPDELYDVTVMLMAWAEVRGLRWDVEETPAGDRFAARLEFYHNGPEDPPEQWTSEIRIRLRD
ncbi:effector-binding domain-containing protein [Palleronia marisminoris]|uniref:Bacterial transcription activator, effector binding domain n=1 Tax=Palleronia marisminoris TaxID=315423 RepID=A0A1Y5RV26_9RHOB|nr:GyrI-like domain-containing protein [Palleronia marisminoris]SFG45342.1 effector-binding domain-containing protein [Palleronia marisminoris]SLN26051.1 Bacterial transcription activator, effector binding domain [Palleronia marisminoris]